MSQIVTTNPAIEMERKVKALVRDLSMLIEIGMEEIEPGPHELSTEMKALLGVLANTFASIHLIVDGERVRPEWVGIQGPAEIIAMGAEMMRNERKRPAPANGGSKVIPIHH